jgi:hypothetical protein
MLSLQEPGQLDADYYVPGSQLNDRMYRAARARPEKPAPEMRVHCHPHPDARVGWLYVQLGR